MLEELKSSKELFFGILASSEDEKDADPNSFLYLKN